MKKLLKNKLILLALVFVAGIIIGKIISPSQNKKTKKAKGEKLETTKKQIWTCSMHPQIRSDKPGKCPICGMELIPLHESSSSKKDEMTLDPNAIQMTEEAMKLAEIQTAIVKKERAVKELYLNGKVKADERNIASLTARFGGRIEKLYVNFTGQNVQKGQKLASIYSPELITAQKELFEAIKFKNDNPSFYRAARNKLKLWDLTEEQIDDIESNGKPMFYFDVLSPIKGIIIQRNVALGDYVKIGDPLFDVIDLSHIWVMFEAYESDIPWIKVGDKVKFTVQSLPGMKFTATVTYIDPFINPQTRVALVRTELNNPGLKLKPGMFAHGLIKAKLPFKEEQIIIPKSAVLWTGKRSLVYVKDPAKEHPTFIRREITLGEDAGDYYVVKNGLKEGEEIAVNGVFRIDAAAQLAGKPSMMNPQGGTVMTGHHHGNMKIKIPFEFKKQLGNFIDSYISVKDALTKDNFNNAKKYTENIKKKLKMIDMKLLKGNAHIKWMSALENLNKILEKTDKSEDIEVFRKNFASLSNKLIEIIQVFGIKYNSELFIDFCPMALNNKGAYWISQYKEIKNPYFGQKMPKCGEIKQILK